MPLEQVNRNMVDIEDRVVRHADLVPCLDAFIDTRTPGSDRKENFTIIGPGVSENPNQHVHIAEPHGFNVGGARQPPGCTNSQHSHDTAEVFLVHSGHWRFDLGEHGQDARAHLNPGDLISIPTRVFRGFTNIGDDTGFLWAILGGDDPGRVLWAPAVFEMARKYGLILLENGNLIDTNSGETIPAGKRAMPVTTPEQVAALDRLDDAGLESCIVRSGSDHPKGRHDALTGVSDTIICGRQIMDRYHGFVVSRIVLAPGAAIPDHGFGGADVLFVHRGRLHVSVDGRQTTLDLGDTITIPGGVSRRYRNDGDVPVTLVAVRGDEADVEAMA